jgi:hypothetical protein
MNIESNIAESKRPDVPACIAVLRTSWPQNLELPSRAPHWSFDESLATKQRAAYRNAERERRAALVMAAMLA